MGISTSGDENSDTAQFEKQKGKRKLHLIEYLSVMIISSDITSNKSWPNIIF